jgi:predicted RNase H-like HicB family nuclease
LAREIKGERKMKKYDFTVIIERDEDGVLIGSVPQLKGCHTQAKSIDELLKRIREVIELCIEVEKVKQNEWKTKGWNNWSW